MPQTQLGSHITKLEHQLGLTLLQPMLHFKPPLLGKIGMMFHTEYGWLQTFKQEYLRQNPA